MGSEWEEVAVEVIAAESQNALATGPFGSAISSRFFVDSGIPVIRGSNLSEDVGIRLKEDGLVFVSEDKAKEFRRSIVRTGDLVFTCWGTVNQVGLIEPQSSWPEYIISNKQMKLTPDPRKADSLFLYYLFSSEEVQQRILSQAIGSSVPGFNLGQLRSMLLRLPKVREQRAIAHILGTLDDRIELNRRLTETLEAMARALFKSWFVDFDPVRAKMDGRWQRGASLPGLPADLYELIPDRLVESDMGEVPEGWEVRPLEDLLDAERGLSYKGKHLADHGVPMHNLNSILEGGGYKYEGIKYYAGQYHKRHRLSPGDLIVANTEQGHDRLLIGYSAIVPGRFGSEGIFSHHLYRVFPKQGCHLTRVFLCYLLNSGPMQQVVSGYANGTTVNMLPLDALRLPRLPVPPEQLVARFTLIADGVQARQEHSISESVVLADVRDALLPKLISGELRVEHGAHLPMETTV